MQTRLITSVDELIANRIAWDSVAENQPFLRWSWMVNWLRYGIENVSPAVLVGLVDEQWVGIAPFCIEQDSARLIRKLRLLGSGKACSDYVGLIVRPPHQRTFTECVADWIASGLQSESQLGRVDAIELEGCSLDDSTTKYLFELLSANGLKQHDSEIEGCWQMDLEDSWERQNQSFSKSLRRKTKKARQRLRDPQTRVFSSDDTELDQLWPSFVDLHQQRREMLGQAGCFADHNFENWLKDVTRELVGEGRAELLLIENQQEPLASFLLFNDSQTVFMYQSGISAEKISLEPGYQIAVLAIERTIEKGFKKFDFLRGDEPYKSRWLTQRVALTKTRFVPRRIGSQVKHGIWATGRSLKQYWNQANSTDE